MCKCPNHFLKDEIKMFKFSKEVFILCFGILMTQFANMVAPMLTLILQQQLSLSATSISYVVAINYVALVIASYYGGKIADFYVRKWNIVFCDIISIVLFLIGGLIKFSWITIVLIILGGSFQQMELASYNTLVADYTKEEERDKAYSTFYLFFNIGLFLSTAISGFLITKYMHLVFLMNALGILLSSLVIWLFLPAKKVEKVDKAEDEEKMLVGIRTIIKSPALFVYLIMMCVWESIHNEYTYLVPLEINRAFTSNQTELYGVLVSFSCLVVVTLTTITANILHGKKG